MTSRLRPLWLVLLAASVTSAQEPTAAGRWVGDGGMVVELKVVGRSPRDTEQVAGTVTWDDAGPYTCSFVADQYGNYRGGYTGKHGRVMVSVHVLDGGKRLHWSDPHGSWMSSTLAREEPGAAPRKPGTPPTGAGRAEPQGPAGGAETAKPTPAREWRKGKVIEVDVRVTTRDNVTVKRAGTPDATTTSETVLESRYQDTITMVDGEGSPTRFTRRFLSSTRTAQGRAARTELDGREVQFTATQVGRWGATLDGREVTGAAAQVLASSLSLEDPTLWRVADGSRQQELKDLARGRAPHTWPGAVHTILREFTYNVTRGSWSTDVSGAPERLSAEVVLMATQRLGPDQMTERVRRVSVVQTRRVLAEGEEPPPLPPPTPVTSAPNATPTGAKPADAPPPANVRVGQRYRYRDVRVDVVSTQEVIGVSGETIKVKLTQVLVYPDGATAETSSSRRVWDWTPQAVPKGQQLGRETIVVSGVSFDCVVVEFERGDRKWFAVDPRGMMAFPGLIKCVNSNRGEEYLRLEAIEGR